MSLSRGGLELNEIWAKQALLVERDEDNRRLERRWRESGDPNDAAAWHRAMTRSGHGHEAAHAILANPMHSFVAHHRKAAETFDKISNAYNTYDSSNPKHKKLGQQIKQWEKEHGAHHTQMREAGHKAKALATHAGLDTSDHFAHHLPEPKTDEDHKRNLDAAIKFHDEKHERGRRTIFHTHRHAASMGSEDDARKLVKTIKRYDPHAGVDDRWIGRPRSNTEGTYSVYTRHNHRPLGVPYDMLPRRDQQGRTDA